LLPITLEDVVTALLELFPALLGADVDEDATAELLPIWLETGDDDDDEATPASGLPVDELMFAVELFPAPLVLDVPARELLPAALLEFPLEDDDATPPSLPGWVIPASGVSDGVDGPSPMS
jgi:hypothetical protein